MTTARVVESGNGQAVRLADLVSLLPVLELPSEAANQHCEIRVDLEAKGRAIGG